MKKFRIEFNWAIIYTLASLVWMAGERAVGLHDALISKQALYTLLFGIVAIPVYFLALNDKKKNYYHGKANWTQLFLSGVMVSIFVVLFSPLALYIGFHYVSPDFVQNNIHYYVSTKHMAPENAVILFSFRSYILQAISNGISIGVIISAVVALFIKTEAAAMPEPVASRPKTKSKQKKK